MLNVDVKCGLAQGIVCVSHIQGFFAFSRSLCIFPGCADGIQALAQGRQGQSQAAWLTCGYNLNRRCDAQIATKEGLPGFYRGFGAMLVGLVPASAAYFGG